jgi:hypothetical protein
LLICVAVVMAMVFARPAASLWGRWLGLGLLGLAFAVVVQALAPTAAPVIAWPLLLTGAGAALAAGTDPDLRSRAALGGLAVLAALGIAQSLSLAHLAFLGVGADAPAVMAVFALLTTLLIWPLLADAGPPRVVLIVAGVLAVLAVGLALSVRLDPPAATIPAYSLKLAP